MDYILLIIPFCLAIILGRAIIPYILLITYKKRLFDPIDARKLHQTSIPRLGGLAFMPTQLCIMALSLVIIYNFGLNTYFVKEITTWKILPMFVVWGVGMVMLFIMGVADDLVHVHYKWKFLVQIVAALLFPISGLWINDLYGFFFIVGLPYWFGAILTVFATVLIINSINLIDGLDGLCSGLVCVSCLVMGGLFFYNGAWVHTLLAWITAGVLIPFFYYNVFGVSKRRRRIFMGDTGSMTLGYTVAFLAISYSMNLKEIKPFAEGAIVVAFSTLLVPVFDVLRVIVVRFLAKKPLFKADRSHLHHKLLRSGMSQHGAMMSIIGLSLFFSIFNLIAVQYISNNVVILMDLVLWGVMTLSFNYIVNKKKTVNI
ncbi:MraY family glycosyltransferase [Sphingobacterium bovistauri]|uniref:Undecaprenyl/decaprenyl-phosphate alpha-N-acetylglucosaminyl 1-phosphate transferase n=1 Tax=Sphingobacterium bovistauri TaxID=2781959 RepID=A0ABS7Z566_9SPHI|nr:MraY family glycosyltransferase [Sphingobacterium bovistauri]MCA5004104.1 undecaprenyl/decaprenyl-phosphate alpha-N-acetylglucosaminyl 1-phosphate transferase [Sphingobacterium bovistauri]